MRSADVHHLVLPEPRRVGALFDGHVRQPRKPGENIGHWHGNPAADVEDRRLAPLGREPVRAHDVAYVGEVAPRLEVAGRHRDLTGLAGRLGGRSGVFFDTSVWSPLDLLDLYRLVAPEQILYASDYPYGQQPASLLITTRTARLAGFDEPQMRDLLAGNANRIIAGEPPAEPTRPTGSDTFAQPLTFARIHQYLSMATPLLWTRQADTIGVLGLALNACFECDGYREEAAQIRELLLTANDLWRAWPDIEDDGERMIATRTTFRLIHLADILALTSGA